MDSSGEETPIGRLRMATARQERRRFVNRRSLEEPWPLMKSLQFLAETHVFGILIHPWKIVGLTGSVVFGLRFLIQWIASERAKKSVIPFGFRSEERRV